jgi:YVTN family beta-propeller protein
LDGLKVGVQADGRIVVPTNQIIKPAGKQITFPGRPVDLAFAEDGKTLVVKNMRDLVFIDVATAKVKQTLALPSKRGFSVVGLIVRANKAYASDARDSIRIASRGEDGSYAWDTGIALRKPAVGGLAHGAGLAFAGKDELLALSTRGNSVQRITPTSGLVEQVIPVGVAPYMIRLAGPDRAYVTNWGGDPPAEGDARAKSSKSPIRIDPRTGVANHGSVSVLRRADGQWKQTKTVRVGLHPSGMVLSPTGLYLYVANANSDSISVIGTRTDTVVETISCRPQAGLPLGSGPNAVAVSADGLRL